MRKLLLIFCLAFSYILIGCDFIGFEEEKIEIIPKDNIVIAYDDVINNIDNYNWRAYIDIYVDDNKLTYANSDIIVTKIEGDPYIDEVCKFQVYFNYNGSQYTQEFYVNIDNKLISISDVWKTEEELIRTCGEIIAVKKNGFILADNNNYLYIALNTDYKYQAKVGDSVEVIGYKTDSGLITDHIYSKTLVTFNPVEYLAINDNDWNNYQTSAKNSILTPTAVQIKGIISEEAFEYYDSKYYLVTEEKTIYLDAIGDIIRQFKDSEVTIDGFIYELNDNQIALLARKVFTKDEEINLLVAQTNYHPIVEMYFDTLHFLNKPNFSDLLEAFDIYDPEDGQIIVNEEMVEGSFDEYSNHITINYTDSDENSGSIDLTVFVGDYQPNNMIHYGDTMDIDPQGMPSKGDINVLVIPVDIGFNTANSDMLKTIEKAFFGTEEDTGWESLKSFYQKSSGGKLNINGTVTPWYHANESQSYYARYQDDDDYIYGSTIIMEEALTYFKDTYNYADFDSNYDGYIDAVYLIYNVDIGGNGSYNQEDFYWAYTAWDTNLGARNYANTLGYAYVFMGYDFFNDPFEYSNIDPLINTETLIHETGHLMNADDYYDYDTYDAYGNDGGYCGIDMMDWNIGDHGPFTKMLFGWTKPIEIKTSGIYEIPSFTTSNTCFVISPNRNFNSVFSEYYLIDYYTFAGLNSLEIPSFLGTEDKYAGIRISLVNATLTYEDGYMPYFKYNNTDTKYKLLRMLEADYDGTFDLSQSTNEGAELSDFYRSGDVFGLGSYQTFISSDGKNIPFTLEVLSCDEESAIVKIIFK